MLLGARSVQLHTQEGGGIHLTERPKGRVVNGPVAVPEWAAGARSLASFFEAGFGLVALGPRGSASAIY